MNDCSYIHIFIYSYIYPYVHQIPTIYPLPTYPIYHAFHPFIQNNQKNIQKILYFCTILLFTLSTNKYAPAPLFYRKNGFVDCEHVLFMAKEIE